MFLLGPSDVAIMADPFQHIPTIAVDLTKE
jgi:histidinol dehydrogenase